MQSKIKEKSEPVRVGPGVFGYVFHDPLPEPAKEAIADFAKVIAGTEQDIEKAAAEGFPYLSGQDLKGTYYARPAIVALNALGMTLTFMDQRVRSAEDIDALIANGA